MKPLHTKFSEEITTTSVLEEMKGKFLGKRLLRTWNEDFADEDTGEVVSIERNELIFEKGTELNSENLTQINFLLQSNDIKEVCVSNQKREAKYMCGTSSVWIVSVLINNKQKTNIYLYANSVDMAMNVSTDFLEQQYTGIFKFTSVKELDYFNLIPPSESEYEDTKTDFKFYTVEVDVIDLEEESSYNQKFLLKASDAEYAKNKIIVFLTNFRKENNLNNPFEVKTISAKTIACNNIIDFEFSKKYFESKKEEQ